MPSSRTLLIEGWRFIPHSYAIVNQFQCLQMLKRPGLRIVHRDVPYFNPSWRPTGGLFSPADEERIRAIPSAAADQQADAVLRITYPYDCSPSRYARTFVFGTAEFRVVPNHYLAQNRPLRELARETDVTFITPSNWSRDGFLRSGAPADRVIIIPHGVDPAIFHPRSSNDRESLRRELGWDGFVFLTLGSLTGNKGLPLLLKAFAEVSRKHQQVRLVIKGMEALYQSRELLQMQSRELSAEDASRVQERLLYFGHTLSFSNMARMYQAADAYVSPYSGEGFNMPVLEAIACGLPVICTAGGSTDDFTSPDFTLPIVSTVVDRSADPNIQGDTLKPDFDSLLHQMLSVVENATITERARSAGPKFVGERFTWRHVEQQLFETIFPA